MNANGTPETMRPSGSVAMDQCRHSTSSTSTPPTSTRTPHTVARTWSDGSPWSSSSARTSALHTTGAPVRVAMANASPRWSGAAWVTRITSGRSRSSGPHGALGLAVRNGSIRMRWRAETISYAATPRKRMRVATVLARSLHVRALEPVHERHHRAIEWDLLAQSYALGGAYNRRVHHLDLGLATTLHVLEHRRLAGAAVPQHGVDAL